MTSRQVACAIALISVVGVSLNAIPWFLSMRSASQVVPDSSAASSPKEASPAANAYRYDGKTFEQWQAAWPKELKLEPRCEALRAMGMLGSRGDGKRAAEAILEMVRDYQSTLSPDSDRDALKLERDAVEALSMIGGDAAASAALQSLKNGDVHMCRFSEHALRHMRLPPSAMPALFGIVRGDSESRANLALGLVGHHCQENAELETVLAGEVGKVKNAADLLHRLERAMKKADSSRGALVVTGMLGTSAQPAVPALLESLRRETGNERVQAAIVRALGKIAGDPDRVIPLLLGLLNDTDRAEKTSADVRKYAVWSLGQFGPEAQAAVPALLRELKNNTCPRETVQALARVEGAPSQVVPPLVLALKRELDAPSSPAGTGPADATMIRHALDYLGKAGPEAKEAVPVLARIFRHVKELQLRGQVVAVLEKIGPAAQEVLPQLRKELPAEAAILLPTPATRNVPAPVIQQVDWRPSPTIDTPQGREPFPAKSQTQEFKASAPPDPPPPPAREPARFPARAQHQEAAKGSAPPPPPPPAQVPAREPARLPSADPVPESTLPSVPPPPPPFTEPSRSRPRFDDPDSRDHVPLVSPPG